MTCPECGGGLVNWSEASLASYGNACLACRLFIWSSSTPENLTATKPLSLAPFPFAYRSIPAYREAVDWVGP